MYLSVVSKVVLAMLDTSNAKELPRSTVHVVGHERRNFGRVINTIRFARL